MNLLCHHSTIRPTVARAIAEVRRWRTKESSNTLTGWSSTSYQAVFGDIGIVTLVHTQTHIQLWDIKEYGGVQMGMRYFNLTCAELRAFLDATYERINDDIQRTKAKPSP